MQKIVRIYYQHRNTTESSSGRKKIPDKKQGMKNTAKGKLYE